MPAENIPAIDYLLAAVAVCSPIAAPIVSWLSSCAEKNARRRKKTVRRAEPDNKTLLSWPKP